MKVVRSEVSGRDGVVSEQYETSKFVRYRYCLTLYSSQTTAVPLGERERIER